MAAKQGSTKLPAAAAHEAAGDFDPEFEWIDNSTNYVLRLNLLGFNKDDFRVQVDGAGRLTVRSQHAPPPPCFHKVFQLPSTASLDDISGRFHASVLTLTVPKRAAAATAPTTIEEICKKPTSAREGGAKPPPKEKKHEADVVKPKEEINKEDTFKKALLDEAARKAQHKDDDAFNKAMDEATRKVQHKEDDEANRRKQEQAPAVRRDEVKPKAAEAAVAPTEKPASKPEIGVEKAKAVDRESLAERVRRFYGEEEAAAAAEEAALRKEKKRIEFQSREKKTACGRWKERVAGELEELTDMKWADGLVEMATNNKEVLAAAIAAFSLGFFVSQKLFSRM